MMKFAGLVLVLTVSAVVSSQAATTLYSANAAQAKRDCAARSYKRITLKKRVPVAPYIADPGQFAPRRYYTCTSYTYQCSVLLKDVDSCENSWYMRPPVGPDKRWVYCDQVVSWESAELYQDTVLCRMSASPK